MKYEPALPLWRHQQESLDFALSKQHAGLLLDMGCGKSAVAIAVAGHRFVHQNVRRVLIVCPAACVGLWAEREIPKHLGLEGDQWAVHVARGAKEKRKQAARDAWEEARYGRLSFLVTNYDVLRRDFEHLAIYCAGGLIVADESTRIKNHKAKVSKAAWKIGKDAATKLILTGTPYANDPLDVWSQWKFMNPNRFPDFVTFRARYCVLGGPRRNWVLGPRNADELREKMSRDAIRYKREEVLPDLPDVIEQTLECEPSDDQRKWTKRVADQLRAECEAGVVTIENALTRALRLQQIASGHIQTDEGRLVEFGCGKDEDARSTVQSIIDEGRQVVVFTRFDPDARKIVAWFGDRAAALVGSTNDEEREQNLRDFNDGKVSVLVANSSVGGYGLDLTVADTLLYYSHDWSPIVLDQTRARNHRPGAERHEKIHRIYCVTSGSIENHILRSLNKKIEFADWLTQFGAEALLEVA